MGKNEKSQKRLRDHRRQLRILKIKKINLKKRTSTHEFILIYNTY